MDRLVSIIIPTYNREEFISGAVDSVLQQTYDNFECIIIDGGSQDSTQKILNSYQDDRICLKFRESPQGIARARNVGIKLACGEFICFLDDDDRMRPTAVETLVEAIRDQPSDCAGVYCARCHLDESGNPHVLEVPDGRVHELENANIGGFSCTMIRRAIFDRLGMIDESFPACEDSDLWSRIFSDYFLLGINEVLYNRLIHSNQTIKDDEKMVEGKRRLLEKHDETLSDSYKITQRRAIFRGLLRLERYSEARSELRILIQQDKPRHHYLYYYFWLLFGGHGYNISRMCRRQIYDRISNRSKTG